MPDLSAWRAEFPILETCTYLVSHSLGAMPRRAADYLQQFADTWATRGVRAWHEGWWEIGRTTGDLLAPIIGAAAGTISMHQNVTVAQAIVPPAIGLTAAHAWSLPTSNSRRTPTCTKGFDATAPRSRTFDPTMESARISIGCSMQLTTGPPSYRCRWSCSRAPTSRMPPRLSRRRIALEPVSFLISTRPLERCRSISAASMSTSPLADPSNGSVAGRAMPIFTYDPILPANSSRRSSDGRLTRGHSTSRL